MIELWDQAREEVLGFAQIHIWDTFRDPWAEWAGQVVLKRDKDIVGTVSLAMRLQIPQKISVAFNKTSELHPPLSLTRVHPSDTPRDFRHKVTCNWFLFVLSKTLLSVHRCVSGDCSKDG